MARANHKAANGSGGARGAASNANTVRSSDKKKRLSGLIGLEEIRPAGLVRSVYDIVLTSVFPLP